MTQNTSWDEVKRLALDFQKMQLSCALYRLSERNCIEIVTKLIEKKLLNVIFTIDGKEYITPEYLITEIENKLFEHNGRITLVELSSILNVDLSLITKFASDMEKSNKHIKIILDNLIDNNYISKIAKEINNQLCKDGFISVVDLMLYYDLPADFLQSVIEKELGKTILGKQDLEDPRIFYNQNYIARIEAKVRGALSAITKPTQISAILGQCSIPEKIFFAILENLHEKCQVPGIITGKHCSNSIYLPSIYSKSQNEWVENFYKHNGYLEYDVLLRLGISDPKNFVKRHFTNRDIMHLNAISINPILIDQVDVIIEEVIATRSFTDINSIIPTVFNPKDIELFLKETSLKKQSQSFLHVFALTVIVSDVYLQELQKQLEPLAKEKAQEIVVSGKWPPPTNESKTKSKHMDIEDNKIDRKAERRKKAYSGKAGGGSQGRETKTKSIKKKYNQFKNQDNDSDNEQLGLENEKVDMNFLKIDDIQKELNKDKNLADMDEFMDELSKYLCPLLNKQVLQIMEQLLPKHKTIDLSEIDNHLNALITNIKVFDKGTKYLDKYTQEALAKYLLKTLVVDFITEIFKLCARQNVIQHSPNLTTETREKILQDLPNDVKKPLANLHKVVAGNNLEDFFNAVEPAMSACCLVLRKYDKKKDRFIIVDHREALLKELSCTQDPALVLHLTTIILFIAATQNTIHISGRHVSSILSFLQYYLRSSTSSSLINYHDLLLKFLSSSNAADKEVLQKLLQDDLQEIKTIATEYSKQLKTNKEDGNS